MNNEIFKSKELIFKPTEKDKKTIYSMIEYFSKIIEYLEENEFIFEIQYPPYYEKNNNFINEIDLKFLVDIANSFIDNKTKIVVKNRD